MLHETARRRWRVSEAGFYFDIQSCQTWRRLDRKGNILMRIGVCDDIREVREQLAGLVKSLYPDAMVVCYKDGGQVLEEKRLPDILFLDIQMAGINGMETAKQLRQTGKKMIIIFVTALEEYVFDAFDVKAFHYLVKPFSDEKFAQVLQKAVEEFTERKEPGTEAGIDAGIDAPNFIIKTDKGHVTICPAKIVYAEVFNRKVVIHTLDEDIEYYGKMKDLERQVGDGFYRPHRSYLVNMAFIKKYNSAMIYLERGQAAMAKQNYPEFVKCYLRYNQRGRR